MEYWDIEFCDSDTIKVISFHERILGYWQDADKRCKELNKTLPKNCGFEYMFIETKNNN